MKKYINELKTIVLNRINNNDADKQLIRLDHFMRLEIYYDICSELKKRASDSNIKFIAKLSKDKFDYFSRVSGQNIILDKMLQEDFIDEDNRMTYWRNAISNTKGTVILMGTEAVQDRGGLADFYCIEPSSVEKSLENNYAKWFEKIVDISNESDAKIIHNFIKILFKHTSIDLLKLSNIIDRLESIGVYGLEDTLSALGQSLWTEWNVPNIKSFDSNMKLQISNGKFALIEKGIKFRDRVDFRDTLTKSKFEALQKKLDQYSSEHDEELIAEYLDNSFDSYEDYKQAVIMFNRGENLDELRGKLCSLDFTITDEILNVKLPKGSKPTKSKNVYGAPFEALAKLIVFSYSEHEEKLAGAEINKIIIKVNEVLLADCVSSDGDKKMSDDVFERWREVCLYCGGLLDYFNGEAIYDTHDNRIEFVYHDGMDPFQIENIDMFSHKIKAATLAAKLSSVQFEVDINGHISKYKWVFNPNNFWVQSFNDIPYILNEMEKHNKFLPISYDKKIQALLNSSNEEEFFSLLRDHNNQYVNACELQEIMLRGELGELFVLNSIVDTFRKFVAGISKKGLYGVINPMSLSAEAINFIGSYCKIINYVVELLKTKHLNSVERDSLNLFSNLFYIVKDKDDAENNLELEAALIPPYHPAMLEKIVEQNVYFREGICNLINRIIRDAEDVNVLDYIEYLNKNSAVISGVDMIVSTNRSKRLCSNVYGYYGIYGSINDSSILSNSSIVNTNIIFDEDFNTKEMMRNTPISDLVKKQIEGYIKTFPSQLDDLKLCFVNFKELQPIVAGVHKFLATLEEENYSARIRLQIISTSSNQEGRNYLNFWLDNYFDENNQVVIETYYQICDLNRAEKRLYVEKLMFESDITFIQNILELKSVEYSLAGNESIAVNEARFPMVFHPMPVCETNLDRGVSITQTQFQAAFVHTQLLHWIENRDKTNGNYRVEKVLQLNKSMENILDVSHERSNWVVTLDTGLDKNLLKDEKIVSFSTGEGSYGELNMTISTSRKVQDDISYRLRSRLSRIFHSWDSIKLESAATYCLKKAKMLDGIKLIKALNPKDYEIHSFLAYILSAETVIKEIEPKTKILSAYIPLDSYFHWFIDQNKRTDFLLFEIYKEDIEDGELSIYATLVECKMGKENDEHISKGLEQLTESLEGLSQKFDPNSKAFNRRYWYAQLYRALVFSPLLIDESTKEELGFDIKLQKILEGNFVIHWNSELLTYWLDNNEDTLQENYHKLGQDEKFDCIHRSFGQIYIQKHLLPENYHSELQFEMLDEQMDEFVEEDDYDQISDVIYPKFDKVTDTQILTNSSESRSTQTTVQEEQRVPVAQDEEYKGNGSLTNSSGSSEEEHLQIKHIDQVNGKSLDFESKKLENIRIYLGKDIRTKQEHYWEYGHPDLENRHILISGKSGVGKTYFIQCMLLELAKNDISSVIFDYTDGFKKSKLEPEFKDYLGDNLVQFFVMRDKFPINPFKRQEKELDEGEYMPESNTDVAERIKSVFQAVYKGIGPQQANAIYRATMNGLDKYGNKMDLNYLKSELEQDNVSNAATVLSLINPLIDRAPFDTTNSYNWDEHRSKKGTVFVVQLSGFVREVQLIITEFILWDLWNFNLHHGDKSIPFPVVLDEAQNLDHSEHSPSAKILTEGRKFGWSGWYATQFMKDQLKKDEIQRLQNASQKVYFSPPEAEISDISSYLEPDTRRRQDWYKKLSELKKGQCIISGSSLRSDGRLEKHSPKIIQVAPFSERI